MKQSTTPLILIAAVFVFISCCICLAILIGAGLIGLWNFQPPGYFTDLVSSGLEPTNTPPVIRPTLQATANPQGHDQGSGKIAAPEMVPADQAGPNDTLETLKNTSVPMTDQLDLASRLKGRSTSPPLTDSPALPRQLGDQASFWVDNTDDNEIYQVQASLRYITDHAYFWIEDGTDYKQDDLVELAETFESQIYPTTRAFFGSEHTPGIDGDPHLYILYASGLGRNISGYFSSRDANHPLTQEYSNGHEMFVLNADNINLREEFTYGVLAHEFQHMIHSAQDRNETSWLNEGFSDLAMTLNGYDIGGHDYLYAKNPDLQLNDWPNDPYQTAPHYGASFLFLDYFLGRFGREVTQRLVKHPANDLESIDQLLSEINATDTLTGDSISADDVFADWVIASYLNDPEIADSRFSYQNYPEAPRPSETETIRSCSSETLTRDIRQYGVDYIRIKCRGNPTLLFEGSTQVSVLPADPHSGSYAFWSNKGDESDMTLTRAFDFSDQSGPLTLTYWTWYDIEKNYDYVYLEASEDGENWQILTTPSGTSENPVGENYGWGYNGLSGGGPSWIEEEIDLSAFAGKKIQLRFEYITDAAVNGDGFLLDDIAIREVGYFSDFEQDNGGWEANGFVRIQNVLPQNFRLELIGLGRSTSVEYIQLTDDNRGEIRLNFDEGFDEYILVVSGTTRFTRQPTAYRFRFAP